MDQFPRKIDLPKPETNIIPITINFHVIEIENINEIIDTINDVHQRLNIPLIDYKGIVDILCDKNNREYWIQRLYCKNYHLYYKQYRKSTQICLIQLSIEKYLRRIIFPLIQTISNRITIEWVSIH